MLKISAYMLYARLFSISADFSLLYLTDGGHASIGPEGGLLLGWQVDVEDVVG